jgi:hypothetical protein
MERFRDIRMEWFHSIPPHAKTEHTLEERHERKPVGTKRPTLALAPDRSWAPRAAMIVKEERI